MQALLNSPDFPWAVVGLGAAVVLLCLGVFLACWLTEPRRLVNGVLFNILFVVFWAWLGGTIIVSKNEILILVTGTLFLIAVVLIALIWATSAIWLLLNARIVWKRESHTVANMLTLLTGIAIIILWVLTVNYGHLPQWLQVLVTTANVVVQYGTLILFNFVSSLLIYQFYPIPYKQQYIIVLGAGLLNGDTVSPLLAARIERGMKFYYRQIRKGRPAPMIIFSGGQGADEKLSEAAAMRAYAVAHGIPEEATLLEDMSTTTQENLRFSKAIIEHREMGGRYRAIFVSNNYHIFRAGLYARAEGLRANGRGAHTSFYYLPNAVLREFIAVTLMHKRRHLIVMAGVFALYVLPAMIIALHNLIH
ncbi:ElyC/SanA/YdcF family protein [Schleiferilactobacillus shenzhenensis]|uniref:DUF218 domain-containing protein n=1 Tax=Schleiferilactobacillus shenzhenensis LY-73 TaxID=1231336 RepID=U4TLS4_9LACO|nr:YdcF family protein [Schleiferilactobacillus shenzhenensis]ERL64335.1 hypothetical protein L248_0997 [Schleiferilactobacillus shenzhenensis LY-73]